MGNSIQRPIARFEDFEVHLETGEVWKAGRPLKVQDQPFKVLAALLEQPGQIVTREELRQLIWPDKNFGDFDHAINLALAKLRATLGDSADVPHLIETLPAVATGSSHPSRSRVIRLQRPVSLRRSNQLFPLRCRSTQPRLGEKSYGQSPGPWHSSFCLQSCCSGCFQHCRGSPKLPARDCP